MVIPLLPRLKRDTNIFLDTSGKWICNFHTTLPILTKLLYISKHNNWSLSSIPSVWSRPLSYEKALSNCEHPSYVRYLNEWRYILIILALRVVKHIDAIHLETLIIPSIDMLNSSAPKFLDVISRSLPKEYFKSQKDPTLKKDEIAKIQIIMYETKPLAFIWPSILICPSVELTNIKISTIPAVNHLGIQDPILCLSDEDKMMMSTWLNEIIYLSSTCLTNNIMLMKLLISFRDEIVASVGSKFKTNKNQNMIANRNQHKLNITGSCHYIGYPVEYSLDD